MRVLLGGDGRTNFLAVALGAELSGAVPAIKAPLLIQCGE